MALDLREPLILSVSGPDRPGILAYLSRVLVEADIEIVDIEQATLQNFLALSFLVDLSDDPEKSRRILHRFFSAAADRGLHVEARVLSTAELHHLKATSLWAVTVLGSGAIANMVSIVAQTTALHRANIVSIHRLAEDDLSAAEFIVDATHVPDIEAFRADLLGAAENASVDISLAPELVYRQSKRVVVMDGDSTLIAGEIIDELAKARGVEKEVSELTLRAMRGELDFTESLIERVKLLKGLEVSKFPQISSAIPLTPGAEETVATLHGLGFKVGLISGGFTFFTDELKERLGLDYAYGNTLEVEDGRLTGTVKLPVLDSEMKAHLLRQIAEKEKVPLAQVVGIGDGANDIPMLRAAGVGVAFRAKEATRAAADGAIHQNSLKGLLYLLGVSERQVGESLRNQSRDGSE